MELLKKATGANLVHVPYRGSAPAVTDLLPDRFQVAVVDLTSAHPHIKAGTLLALGVPHVKRTAMAPDIPTVAEAGVQASGASAGSSGCWRLPARPLRSSSDCRVKSARSSPCRRFRPRSGSCPWNRPMKMTLPSPAC